MRELVLFIGALLLFVNAEAQTQAVRIFGNAPDYAGRKIALQVSNDPVSDHTETLVELNILPDGSFDESVLINQTTCCFATFDRWKAVIYLQPTQSYELVFPPSQPLTEQEKRNPFFRSSEIAFGLKDLPESDINRLIQKFESAYNDEENRYFNEIFKDKSTAAADLMLSDLNSQFPKSENSYFENYKFFRLTAIRFALSQDKTNSFVKTYIDRTPIDFNLPPFREIFDQQFTNFFYQESNKIGGDQFRVLVGTANLSGIENNLTKQKGWSTKLSRMVILKGISDGYYQAQFNPQTMLVLLAKIAQSDWTPAEKSTAAFLKSKLIFLTKGTAAPDLALKTLNGDAIKLSSLKGKMTYLSFTTVTNPICRQHLDEMKKFGQQFASNVEFVTVLPEADLARKEVILQQNWPGKILIADDKAIETYRVKTFPTAFLLDEDQTFIASPALNPLDGLQQQLAGILKNKRIEELRNQAK
ncbi:peroxiredoxin family protein [Mangrovibacterium diazotrophicum]|uniref:Peroxiredoxin n=1 Tax=Mangrovibacterium diazotrophicum TaxID=1261403 RepID=A0A419W7D2_9BACT|nr:TlpA disulfide reductase family protein [Mangrovibacterium diazotrophicum]RKD91383.1 peroxiredoxin [Mangrovibacterium diazotrophicum]